MSQPFLTNIVKFRIFGKSPVNAYLRLNQRIWKYLPHSLTSLQPIRSYGNFLHALVRERATRGQDFGTLFLRNRPQLELIRRLSDQRKEGSILRICVLGCSKGAEVYSILCTIRSSRPDLKVIMHAVDISKEVLEFARRGVYSLKTCEFVGIPVFGRMSPEEMERFFDKEGEWAKVRAWIKQGITWHVGDAGDFQMPYALGSHDMVVANNFLCHMDPPNAERCLHNIARLVTLGGYLFVSGIDLEVRTKVAQDLHWKPIPDLIEDIHEGDSHLRVDWPLKYWGLEPFNKKRHDWEVRYASTFQLGEKV